MNTGALPEKPLEENTLDRIPSLARLLYFVGLIVSAYDSAVLRQGKLDLRGVGVLGVALFVAGVCLYFLSRLTLGRFFLLIRRSITGTDDFVTLVFKPKILSIIAGTKRNAKAGKGP